MKLDEFVLDLFKRMLKLYVPEGIVEISGAVYRTAQTRSLKQELAETKWHLEYDNKGLQGKIETPNTGTLDLEFGNINKEGDLAKQVTPSKVSYANEGKSYRVR